MSRNSGNMGNPAELEANQRPTSQTKATFSGATAFLGVLSLIITIISLAVPHWGYFGPSGQSYFAQGKFFFFWFSKLFNNIYDFIFQNKFCL